MIRLLSLHDIFSKTTGGGSGMSYSKGVVIFLIIIGTPIMWLGIFYRGVDFNHYNGTLNWWGYTWLLLNFVGIPLGIYIWRQIVRRKRNANHKS